MDDDDDVIVCIRIINFLRDFRIKQRFSGFIKSHKHEAPKAITSERKVPPEVLSSVVNSRRLLFSNQD